MEGIIGIVLAGLSAAANNIGFLMRHRGAVAVHEVEARHPLHSAVDLFRAKWWALGFVLAIVAYLFHAGALTMVALSAIQAIFAAGLVFMAVIAERWFGLEVGPRQWLGLSLAAVGLIALALTGDVPSGQRTANYSPAAMISFSVVLSAVGAAALVEGWRRAHGVLLAVATALILTVTHVALKAASGKIDSGVGAVLATPYVYIMVVGGVVAFFASARSLQIGPGVAVIAVTAIVGNAAAVAAGIIVFGDPLGSDTASTVLRLLAFALVIGASTLIPGPLRARRRAKRGARAPSQPAPRYPAQSARPAA